MENEIALLEGQIADMETDIEQKDKFIDELKEDNEKLIEAMDAIFDIARKSL
jgi:hypothetical protein